MDYEKVTTITEISVVISALLFYFVSNFLHTTGTIIHIIPRTQKKPYYTYIVQYVFLGYFQLTDKYRKYKRRQQFKLNSGVYVYLNYFGHIANIGYKPVVQEEKNIQAQIEYFRIIFIISSIIYIYLNFYPNSSFFRKN